MLQQSKLRMRANLCMRDKTPVELRITLG